MFITHGLLAPSLLLHKYGYYSWFTSTVIVAQVWLLLVVY